MKYRDIRKDAEIHALIRQADENLSALGFTDHSESHACLVADRAAEILETLGYRSHQVELVKIAGYMHDIGNAVNRRHHAEYGALLANDILKQYDIDPQDRLHIVSSIGQHDESTGMAINPVSAALIIADKSDVRRDRVRTKLKSGFDIHDQVNYAVTRSVLEVNKDKKAIVLNLDLDEKICTMYEYFDIFLARMVMCRKAAELLGMKFKLMVNGNKVL
ncbi:MAG: HD domain-containing protein [Succinivibrionaceae bacterium]